MKKLSFSILTIGIAIILWGSLGNKAGALTKEEAVESLYRQLVTEGKNAAQVDTTACFDIQELFTEVEKIDDPNTIHDGTVLSVRGPVLTYSPKHKPTGTKRPHTYRITIENGYDIKEADSVIKRIAKEIEQDLPSNATDTEKLYAISDYIRLHLYYDYEQRAILRSASKDYSEINNVIQALTSNNHGTVCSGFAAATCLIGQEMGLDCQVVSNGKHAYNMFRLSGSDEYIEWDLAATRYGAVTEYLKKSAFGDVSYDNNSGMPYREIRWTETIPQGIWYIRTGRIRNWSDVESLCTDTPIIYVTVGLLALLVLFFSIVLLYGRPGSGRHRRRQTRASRQYSQQDYYSTDDHFQRA